MRKFLSILCLFALLAGCATTDGQTTKEDKLDKTKTGALAGAGYGAASCAAAAVVPLLGLGIVAGCAGIGALYGAGAGQVLDQVEGQ